MISRTLSAGLAVLAVCSLSYSQINLGTIYSNLVRTGRWVDTEIDSVSVETKVNNGSAVTSLTIVARPYGGIKSLGLGYNPGKREVIITRSGADGAIKTDTLANDVLPILPEAADSIEMTLGFQLPADFVADSMWLWIEGKPIDAYIQDRALAAGQYQQIVGTRRDPALLQYSGNGYFNLRIFPAYHNVSRKIKIRFHHTFDDSAGLISAALPLVYDTVTYYSSTSFRQINFVSAAFSSEDNFSYDVNFPGIGSGSFSKAKSLLISSSNTRNIEAGTVYRKDPSGNDEYLWIAHDTRANKVSAGITVQIDESSVRFEDEPDTRIIALDIRNRIWNWNNYNKARAEYLGMKYNAVSGYSDCDILTRAQKFAILALESYVKEGLKFNIVTGGETVQTLFEKAVPAHPEYIKAAVEAILKFTPDGLSSTKQVMDEAVRQASSGIVILISDLIEPYNYYDNTRYPREEYVESAAGKSYNAIFDHLKSLVDTSGITLFTVEDNYRITQIALQSGGYRIGSILNRYSVEVRHEVIDGRRLAIPILPPLFGSRNSSGIRDFRVTSDKLQDIFYTFSNYGRYSGGTGMEIVPVIRMDAMVYPYYTQNGGVLSISGQTQRLDGETVSFEIQGKVGGLKFRKTVKAVGDPFINANEGSVHWAFRKSEALAVSNHTNNADIIKQIGKQYHIITRQTSLLALEPGIKLWEDTLYASGDGRSQAPDESSSAKGGVLASDSSYNSSGSGGSGIELDGVSLADLAKRTGVSPVLPESETKVSRGISAHAVNNQINLRLPEVKGEVVLRIFDLKGRMIIQKRLTADALGEGASYNWNLDKTALKISKGFYMLHVTAGSQKKVFRIPILSR